MRACFPPAVLILALCGCGGSSSPRSDTPAAVAVASANVSFSGGDVDELPFDPRAARIRAARERLAEMAGHPVAFLFDVALLPHHRDSFEERFVESMERAARDLRRLRENDPAAYAWGAPLLRTIDCRYDASADDNESRFDEAGKRVIVTLPPKAYALVPEHAIAAALEAGYEQHREARYGRATPEAVPAAEHVAYFEFLTGYRRHAPARADLSKPEGYVSDPRAETLLTLLRLWELTRDASLRARLRAELLDEGDYFSSAYIRHPGLSTRAPETGTFRRAESAWVRWLRADLKHFDDKQRREVADLTFVRMFNDNVAQYGRYLQSAFRGFDPFAFGIEIVREWIAARHPIEIPDEPERGLLYETIVCPHPPNETGHRSRAPRCEYHFWDYALSTPAGRARLFEAVLSQRDRTFTETAVIDVMYRAQLDAGIELLRALERDATVWTWAVVVLADEFGVTLDASMLDEARRLWRRYPERRGVLLYLLARMDQYGNGKVPWKDLAMSFGGSITERDFDRFLSFGTRASSTAHIVWPALAPGFSRAALLVKHVEPLARAGDAGRGRDPHPRTGIQQVIHRLCEDRNVADLDRLHAFLRTWARNRPSELRALENLIEDTRPGGRCR